MADVFAAAFAAEGGMPWASSSLLWDASSLRAMRGDAMDADVRPNQSPSTGTANSDQRDQSLGPLPLGWPQPSGTGAAQARQTPGGKEGPIGKGSRLSKGPLVCQVEGCGHDLTGEKGYYQRYRVCEPHLKLLSIMVEGKACRFCQQCGRFHELSEFDGNKRSCRARLLQHNARRRKHDPLDTARKGAGARRAKAAAAHPRSDSSNDANPVGSRGSTDRGNSTIPTDKSFPCFSLDSDLDQGLHPASGGAAANPWAVPSAGGSGFMGMGVGMASGASGLGFGLPSLGDNSMQLPGAPGSSQLPSASQLPPYRPLGDGPLAPGRPHSYTGAPGAGALGGGGGGEGRAFDAGALSPHDLTSIDDMLARGGGGVSISGDFSSALDDPRGALLPPAPLGGSQDARGGMGAGYGLQDVGAMGGLCGGLGGMDAGGSGMGLQLGLQQQQQQQLSQHAAGGGSVAMDLASAINMRAMQQQQQRQQQQQALLQQQQHHQQMLLRGSASPPDVMQQDAYMQPNNNANRPSGGAASGPYPTYSNSGGNGGVCSGALGGGVGGGGGLGGGGGGLEPMVTSGSSFTSGVSPYASAGPRSSGLAGPAAAAAAALGASGSLVGGCAPWLGGSGKLGSAAPPAPQPHAGTGAGSSFDLARRLVAGGGAGAQYQGQDALMVRVSIKIANCTPEQLPPDLYQRLRNLLNAADSSLVQGFLRPGCTHLVLDVRSPLPPPQQGDAEDAGGALGCGAAAAPALSAAGVRAALGPLAGVGAVLVQMEGEVALWAAGASPHAAPVAAASTSQLLAGRLPCVAHVSAAAAVDAHGGAAVVVVYGSGLAAPGVRLFARMQGGYLETAVQPLVVGGRPVAAAAHQDQQQLAAATAAAERCLAALAAAGRPASDALLLRVRGAPGSGLLVVEAQQEALLSNWAPCVLLTDGGMAAELSAWGDGALRSAALAGNAAALRSAEAFVADLGLLLDSRSWGPGSAEQAPEKEEEQEQQPAAAAAAAAAGGGEAELEAEVPGGAGAEDSGADGGGGGRVTLDLVCACEQLLAHAADAGLPLLSGFLVRVLVQYGQDLAGVLELPYADGLAIVHRCLRSRSQPAMLRALLGWAAEGGVAIGWGAPGPGGLCALHLAATEPACWAPLAADPSTRSLWASARSPLDGATPLQLQRAVLAALPPAAAQALAAAMLAAVAPSAAAAAAAASASGRAAAATAEPQRRPQPLAVAAPPAAAAPPPAPPTPILLRDRTAPLHREDASKTAASAAASPPHQANAAATAPGACGLPPALQYACALVVVCAAALCTASAVPWAPPPSVVAAGVSCLLLLLKFAMCCASRAAPAANAVSWSLLLPSAPAAERVAAAAAATEKAQGKPGAAAPAAVASPADLVEASMALLLSCAAALVQLRGSCLLQSGVASANVVLALLPLVAANLGRSAGPKGSAGGFAARSCLQGLLRAAPSLAALNASAAIGLHLLAGMAGNGLVAACGVAGAAVLATPLLAQQGK